MVSGKWCQDDFSAAAGPDQALPPQKNHPDTIFRINRYDAIAARA